MFQFFLLNIVSSEQCSNFVQQLEPLPGGPVRAWGRGTGGVWPDGGAVLLKPLLPDTDGAHTE